MLIVVNIPKMYTELPQPPKSEDALYLETIKLKGGSKLRVRYRVMDDNKIEEKKRQQDYSKWVSKLMSFPSYTNITVGFPSSIYADVSTGYQSVIVNSPFSTSTAPIRAYYWPGTASTLSYY